MHRWWPRRDYWNTPNPPRHNIKERPGRPTASCRRSVSAPAHRWHRESRDVPHKIQRWHMKPSEPAVGSTGIQEWVTQVYGETQQSPFRPSLRVGMDRREDHPILCPPPPARVVPERVGCNPVYAWPQPRARPTKATNSLPPPWAAVANAM